MSATQARLRPLTLQLERQPGPLLAQIEAALAPHGVWMAMKGKHPDQELAVLPESVKVFHVEQLQVPGLDAERCIIWMRG